MKISKRKKVTLAVAVSLFSVLLILGLFLYSNKLSSFTESNSKISNEASTAQQESQTNVEPDVKKNIPDTNLDVSPKINPDAPNTNFPVPPANDLKIKETNQVLLKQAEKQNIVVTDADVEKTIDKGLEAYSITKEQLQENLAASGVTYDQYKEALKTQLVISNVVTKNVDLKSITISESEIDEYFQSHKDEFQDFADDPDAMALLRLRIKSLLLRNKQNELVQNYVNTLSQ